MTKPFKLFGIGLNKTGTSSLKLALRRLGYSHCAYASRLVRAWKAGDWAAIEEAADRHESFEDWPWPLVWRRMHGRYGDGARFVLTTRQSPEAWLASLKSHAERIRAGGAVRRMVYGFAYPHGHEAEHLAFYERHNDEVHAFFAAPGRAHLFADLSWDRGHGWRELCGFLGELVPDSPFPHANARMPGEGKSALVAANRRRIAAQLRRIGRTG
ncbi:MAG TPA: sulfotransferase [Paracoccaceae bacterium]|nr:sulfotransferase [Paracoccaceae bacterium]